MMTSFNKIIVLLSILTLTLGTLSKVQAEVVDRVIAVVNNDIITLSELNDEGKTYFQTIMKNVPGNQIGTELHKARKEILEFLIEQLILNQEAEKFNIVIKDEDVNRTIDQIIIENNITLEIFRKSLSARGTTEKKYRQKLRGQLIKSKLVNLEIGSKLIISDEKIQEYYDTFYTAQPGKSGYHIFQIGISWVDGSRKPKSKEEALQQAEYVHKLLVDGQPFTEVARAYSDLPSIEDGGDIGVFAKEEMSQYMRETILAMHPGEISQIIETPNSYQILKLVSAQVDGAPMRIPLTEVKNEITNVLFKQEMEKNYQSWIENLRKNAFIKENL